MTVDCSHKPTYEKLYRDLTPYALKKSLYLLGDEGQAKDIVQDVFAKLWHQPLVFPHLAAAYKWIYRSCHNAAIDLMRTAKRRDELLTESKVVLFPEPKTHQDRISNRQLLVSVMERLDERQCKILAYVVVDGLSHREIADLESISEKTVQRTLVAIDTNIMALRREFYE